jgi:predicted small metal-binding protein
MKTLSCREAGCECDYIAKGETEEEVMRDAADHGIKEHGKKAEDMNQMKEMLRALIHDSGSNDTATSLR